MGRAIVVAGIMALVGLAGTPAPDAEAKSKTATESYGADVASIWLDLLYDIVRTQAIGPPPASRIYGVTAVALYEAVVPGSETNRSLAGQLNALTDVPPLTAHDQRYHWPTAANAAVAGTIRGIVPALTPANLQAVNALEASFNQAFQGRVQKHDFARSVSHGRAVADAVLAWAATDGFASFNGCPYVPVPVPGAWVPTPGGALNPVQPFWGELRPMVLAFGADCAPPGPPAFSTSPGSAFYAAAHEVYQTGVTLTAEQRAVAMFWADNPGATGTPPGHWIAVVGQLARREELSLMAAAEAYARVGIAVTDAFIGCWQVKYAENLQRPVTYIRDHIDPAWLPLLVTPSFPTYTSGHSTQSGAAATVLTDQLGVVAVTDTIRGDHGLLPPLAPRSFASFDDAADEAARSRLYGGIHFGFDNDDGLAAGRCIGQRIVDTVRFRRHD
jgi:hypothetical protein